MCVCLLVEGRRGVVKFDLYVVLGKFKVQGLPRSSHDEEPVVRIRDEMKKVLGRVRREGYCNFQ